MYGMYIHTRSLIVGIYYCTYFMYVLFHVLELFILCMYFMYLLGTCSSYQSGDLLEEDIRSLMFQPMTAGTVIKPNGKTCKNNNWKNNSDQTYKSLWELKYIIDQMSGIIGNVLIIIVS